ncbi:isochorismate synthase [soil metagenome]
MERTNSIAKISTSDFISSAVSKYVESNFSFSLWRLPNSNVIHLAASQHPSLLTEINLEEVNPGFLFASFDPLKEKIHLPSDEYYTFESGQLASSKGSLGEDILAKRIAKESKLTPYYASNRSQGIQTNENSYKSLVTKCVDEVIRRNFEKIVPSRSKTIVLPGDFDLIGTFNKLCQLYPNGMISVFSSPLTGTWVGATPEILVGISKDQQFHTVAVAGTQAYEEGADLRSISWTQKDIEEQALVERYIISCFKKIRLREYEEQGPKTIIAGNVLHLKTDFTVDMVATNFPQLGSIMLKLLHPTSAVCGMPLEASLRFLKENEGYDRQFYSGYLGPVNIEGESNLYVNLRCMQLFANDAILYAGAGVMADSDPEKEWKETEMKMNTLDRTIRK